MKIGEEKEKNWRRRRSKQRQKQRTVKGAKGKRRVIATSKIFHTSLTRSVRSSFTTKMFGFSLFHSFFSSFFSFSWISSHLLLLFLVIQLTLLPNASSLSNNDLSSSSSSLVSRHQARLRGDFRFSSEFDDMDRRLAAGENSHLS